jgi:hypothetical protein
VRKPCVRAAAWLPYSTPLFRQPLRVAGDGVRASLCVGRLTS